jgi:C-terminal processing protease CtpA/Prc
MTTRTSGARRGFARIGLMSALALLGTSFLLAVTEPGARAPQVACVREVTQDTEQGVIGAVVRGYRSAPGYVRVEDVFAGMPAAEAGIEPGDLIVEVDGASTFGLGASVVRAIRGDVDTPVRIKVLRVGEPDPLDFTLSRAEAPGWYPPAP